MSRGVGWAFRVATCTVPGPSFPQNPKIKTVYLPKNVLSVLTWQSCYWQYWLYFTPLLWFKTRPSTPGPLLGLYPSRRASCQWIWNSPSSLSTRLPGCLPLRSHWLKWHLWFWHWAPCWVKLLCVRLTPLDAIFLDSPLMIENVLYYLLKSYDIHKQSFGLEFLEALPVTDLCVFFQCWNERSSTRARPDSEFRIVVNQASLVNSE